MNTDPFPCLGNNEPDPSIEVIPQRLFKQYTELSKREYFAAAALSGLAEGNAYQSADIVRDLAVAAVQYADALIEALNADSGILEDLAP